MSTHSKNQSTQKEGSALIVTIFIVTLVAVISGTLLSRGLTETKINNRNLMLHEARNAAESLQEYASADIIQRFKNDSALSGADISATGISIPTSAASLFDGTNVDLSASSITVGDLSVGGFGYVPSDNTRNDPLAGKYAYTRTIKILSKATVTRSGIAGGTSKAYAYQEFELRDAPLLTHAIFYNMDLIVAPGPTMDIYGPVHTNNNLGVQSANNLKFRDKVTVGGNFYVGHRMLDWEFTGSYKAHKVKFKNDAGNLVSVYNSGTNTNVSSYYDSRHEEWEEIASQRWGGMLKDSAHGIPKLNPVAIGDYVGDDPYTSGTDELENHAYALIEPLLPFAHADRKVANTRLEKFAMKAGLLLKVEVDGTATSGYKVKAYRYTHSSSNELLPTLSLGSPTLVRIDLPTGLIGDADSTMTSIDVEGEPEEYNKTGSVVDGGWYDKRHRQQLDILSLDIGRLKELIDPSVAHPDWDNPGTTYAVYNPRYDWNGVVYVEFPIKSGSGGSIDKIVLADIEPSATGTATSVTPGIALAFIDAATLPAPTYLSNDGLTLATNAPAYIVGHFNSNNSLNSSTTTDPDEIPAAVASDSLTLLSANWITQGRAKSEDDVTSSNRPAVDTEYALGIITGYTPSDPASASTSETNWGGGVQNLPRFLEWWGGRTALIRGSLISLYESEIQTKPYNTSGSYKWNKWFKPPNRNWGFGDLFRTNTMPPGIPSVRHPRLTNLRFLSETEYNSEISGL